MTGPKLHHWIAFILLTTAAAAPAARAGDPSEPRTAPAAAPLSLDQVVDNLVRRNEERARDLRRSETTRTYRLVYRGFPSDREAEMKVDATYQSPSTKNFKVLSESGSKLILDRVFRKLLESEEEAAQPEMRSRTLLNRANYDFSFVGYEPSDTGVQYVLQVTPKTKSKYLYHGKVWIDGTDFAVTRIDAEPAQNPSFWTKKSEIHQQYTKVDSFWVPARNESVSYIRLGGRATLTIEYKDYKLTGARESSPTVPAASVGTSNSQ